MNGFHEIRFPVAVSFRSSGGPQRRTEIVELASGYEERNTPWQHARRRYDAGIGVRSMKSIEQVLAFFEARSGRLYGFRWKDFSDFKSTSTTKAISALDQNVGVGDGVISTFWIQKTYETGTYEYQRPITKLVAGSVQIAVAGVSKVEGVDFTVDMNTGAVTFLAGAIPALSETVSAGFEFDVPVRFDTDVLSISLEAFDSGAIASIPVVEIR